MAHTCSYCGKGFSRKWSKDRHEQDGTCIHYTTGPSMSKSMKPADTTILHAMVVRKFHALEQELHDLRAQVLDQQKEIHVLTARLVQCNHTNTTNNNNSTNTNTTTNNVTNNVILLNKYGNEDVSHISHHDIMNWALDPHTGIVKYFEKKHFDPSKPENKNVKLASIKRNEVALYEGGAWKHKDAQAFTKAVVEEGLEKLQAGIDWNTCTQQVESYFDEVSENPDCKHGKQTQRDVMLVLQDQR